MTIQLETKQLQFNQHQLSIKVSGIGKPIVLFHSLLADQNKL
jgi:hypothetical protein